MDEREAVLGRLWELTTLLSDDLDKGLAERGLTRSRAPVVWQLHQRGPVTQRELAEALGVTARNVTGLVDGLEAAGIVTREPHPTDRRATLITLTERGAASAAEMATRQRDFAHDLFADEPDLATFAAVLDRVLARLRP